MRKFKNWTLGISQLGHKKVVANLGKLTNLANLESHLLVIIPHNPSPNGSTVPLQTFVPFGKPCPLGQKKELSFVCFEKTPMNSQKIANRNGDASTPNTVVKIKWCGYEMRRSCRQTTLCSGGGTSNHNIQITNRRSVFQDVFLQKAQRGRVSSQRPAEFSRNSRSARFLGRL